jgi:adenine-specific DNA-methyltransferase
VDLTLPIHKEEIEGKTVYFVGHDDLAACFDENLDEAFFKALANREAMRVVFKEGGFKDDESKINAEQIFAQLAQGTEVRVI